MSQFTVDQALQIGLQYQQTNQLREAEDIYRQILAAYPDQADALHLLGVLAHQCNQNDAAEGYLRRAIAAMPAAAPGGGAVPYRLSLGSVLQAQNRMEEAIKFYQETLELAPESADVYSHLGVALSAARRFGEAVAAFEEAIRLSPNHPAANGNLGIALCHQGRYEEAVRTLRTSIAEQPKVPAFHASLGGALYRLSQLEAGIAACRQAIALDPNHGQANQTLSLIYMEQGKLEEATAAAQIAAETLPTVVEAQLNYGECLVKKGQLDDARALYEKALSPNPDSAELHTNLANVLKDQGDVDGSIVEFRQAIKFRPASAKYHSNLLYGLQFYGGISPGALFEEHRRFEAAHAAPLRAERRAFPNDRDPNRRLRVGYISNEFRGHVVGLNLLPLIANHRREEVEVFCYADVPKPDFFTYRFQQMSDNWKAIMGLTDEKIAEKVREDKIDILVDLSLHLAGNRLLVLARKPAPVQISFAGYPGTTGMSAIDYRLTDSFLDPLDLPIPSSEVPIRFGESFWCYHPQFENIPVNTLPAKDMGYITFGNFNNFCKINEKTLELWGLVMRGVTRSRLIMLTPEGSHRERTRDFLEKQGIARDRVDFVPRMLPEKYLKAYHRIDVGLDSFPYNGHTTSLDSFFMGVPVVTIIGDTPVSRAGFSQLSNLWLTELAGKSASEFVRLATDLANNWRRLEELRAGLRERMRRSVLMNQTRFAGAIESAYRTVWQRWCAEPVA